MIVNAITPRLIFAVLTSLGLLVVSTNLQAIDYAEQKLFSLSGFATIGLVQGGNEDLGYTRDFTRSGVFNHDTSFKHDSLIGLQLDSHFATDWSATTQLVIRDRTDDDLEEHLEWAFLRYRANDEWSFRLGRTVVDVFALSDIRNVGFAYLWAHPPVEFYGSVIFDYVDGVDFTYSTILSDSYLRLKVFAGESKSNIARSPDDDELRVSPIVGFNATLETGKWSSRVGFATTTVDFPSRSIQQLSDGLVLVPQPVWPEANELSDSVQLFDRDFNYFSIGAGYDDHPWVIDSEIAYIDSSFEFFPNVTSGYVSIGYRHRDMTYFAVLAVAESEDGPKQVVPPANPPIAADPNNPVYALYLGTQRLANDNVTKQRTGTVGVRWDLAPNVALKMQYDRHNVKANGSYLWDTDQQPLTDDSSLDTWSINVNLIF